MVSKKHRYLSIFSPQELWGEQQIAFFRSVIAPGGDVGCSVQDAERKLRFYERFHPGVPHDRTVAQVVTASALKNPKWFEKGKLLVPDRDFSNPICLLEKRIELDLGNVAKQISEGIISSEFQANDYFELQYEAKDVGRGGLTMVTLTLLPCTYEDPILFTVLSYLAIDGQRVRENSRVYRPAFNNTHAFMQYVSNADNKNFC